MKKTVKEKIRNFFVELAEIITCGCSYITGVRLSKKVLKKEIENLQNEITSIEWDIKKYNIMLNSDDAGDTRNIEYLVYYRNGLFDKDTDKTVFKFTVDGICWYVYCNRTQNKLFATTQYVKVEDENNMPDNYIELLYSKYNDNSFEDFYVMYMMSYNEGGMGLDGFFASKGRCDIFNGLIAELSYIWRVMYKSYYNYELY